jgi:protein-disulfide isomerase
VKPLSNFLTTLTLVLPLTFAVPSLADTFTPEQQQEIQTIVKQYLLENPEILLDVSEALQQKQQDMILAEAESTIRANIDKIFNQNSPVTGNPDGSLSLVAFSDYQCGHCKRMKGVLDQLIAENDELKVVNKELPIFGEESEFAAKAALAAAEQGKYRALQDKLFALQPPITEQQILDEAKAIGIDMKKLQKDINNNAIQAEIDNNMELAYALKLLGTPAFIFAKGVGTDDLKIYFIPGAAPKDEMQKALSFVSS